MDSGESEMGRSFSELKMLEDWSLSGSREQIRPPLSGTSYIDWD